MEKQVYSILFLFGILNWDYDERPQPSFESNKTDGLKVKVCDITSPAEGVTQKYNTVK